MEPVSTQVIIGAAVIAITGFGIGLLLGRMWARADLRHFVEVIRGFAVEECRFPEGELDMAETAHQTVVLVCDRIVKYIERM